MWETIALQVGLVLLWRLLSGDKDSSAVETKIFNTTDKDEMVEVVVGKIVADAIKDKGLEPETEAIINDLVLTGDSTALTELMEKPETKKSILDIVGNLLAAFCGLFGGN